MKAIEIEINKILTTSELDLLQKDNSFYFKIVKNLELIIHLFESIYGKKNDQKLLELVKILVKTWIKRPQTLKKRDFEKEKNSPWFTRHEIVGMSLYVDRFSENLKNLENKIPYFNELGVNFLHLMPIMQSPENESDGGYAVSDFTKVDKRFGSMEDLIKLQKKLLSCDMYLMMDVVINHTSQEHDWAIQAKSGNRYFENYFYTYPDREIPDQFEQTMPEIFPHSSPGNFTWSSEMNRWVMTVFNDYQWDLNYTNPDVFLSMMETIFFYGNLGVDILRVDAPAFIWKKLGTTCQNLDEAHQILKLFRVCVDIATPGMAILGEAIVSPKEIMKYFGTESIKECSIAYNATQMALQWDALATGDTTVMIQSQSEIYHKPYGCTWINYTRCHDDIGLGFSDEAISKAGFNPFHHRKFLKEFYSGEFNGSTANGLLFGVNPKTQDARISGTLASLCGLEKAIFANDEASMQISIQKIILMQAHSIFLGGIPMLFYGDEIGYTNDYSYESEHGKSYDNRWVHRPMMDWNRNEKRHIEKTIEQKIFSATKRLISIRRSNEILSDTNNTFWLNTNNKHLVGHKRYEIDQELIFIFNYSPHKVIMSNQIENFENYTYIDIWSMEEIDCTHKNAFMYFNPFQFRILEKKSL